MMVFFENNRCVKCGHPLGFLPDALDLCALESEADNRLRAVSPLVDNPLYRHCANDQTHQMCNWMVPDNDPHLLCLACRLNDLIPNLTSSKNFERWVKLEQAKRRCLYSLLKLGLPIQGSTTGPQKSLSFRFLQDNQNELARTGHLAGVITVNIAEADDDEREHRRVTFHEPYRTLVGHFRHESGHYYWDRLVANSPNLNRFHELFGDDTVNYEAALRNYYEKGPPPGWQMRHVTAYASAHCWEDWAETWAHYLHIMDTLETAASFGVSVDPDNTANNVLKKISAPVFDEQMDFETMMADWIPLTCALNSINRGMGLADLYPFVIQPLVVEKLRFIHCLIHQSNLLSRPAAGAQTTTATGRAER